MLGYTVLSSCAALQLDASRLRHLVVHPKEEEEEKFRRLLLGRNNATPFLAAISAHRRSPRPAPSNRLKFIYLRRSKHPSGVWTRTVRRRCAVARSRKQGRSARRSRRMVWIGFQCHATAGAHLNFGAWTDLTT